MESRVCLSIIIATFNVESCIFRCLKSITEQSYNDFEVLIMDGASTDNSLDIVKRFNDHRIRIYSEKDNGIYDAWNKGIEKSNGHWITFIGADDYYSTSDSLQALINQSYINPTCPLIYGQVESEGVDGNINSYSGEPWFDINSYKFRYFKCNLPFPIMSAIYSKELLGSEKFDVSLTITADADLALRCLRKWSGTLPCYIGAFPPIVRMGYGGVSTNYKSHFKTFKQSLVTRKKNNISIVNLGLAIRAIKISLIYLFYISLGDSFVKRMLLKYHKLKQRWI